MLQQLGLALAMRTRETSHGVKRPGVWAEFHCTWARSQCRLRTGVQDVGGFPSVAIWLKRLGQGPAEIVTMGSSRRARSGTRG